MTFGTLANICKGRFLTRMLLVLAVTAPLCSCSTPRNVLAIAHVTVTDATGSPPQQDMTVLIADQRIAALGLSKSLVIPHGAKILDASRKFLIPSLADMHVHLTGAGEPRGSREFIISLLLANGITTVRDMGGKVVIHNTKKTRALVLRGKLLDRSALDELLASAEKFAGAN